MRPEWSRGIPLDKESTKGRRWFRLLEMADTDEDKLEQIRKARGYKKPWVAHKIRERAETKAGVAAISDR